MAENIFILSVLRIPQTTYPVLVKQITAYWFIYYIDSFCSSPELQRRLAFDPYHTARTTQYYGNRKDLEVIYG